MRTVLLGFERNRANCTVSAAAGGGGGGGAERSHPLFEVGKKPQEEGVLQQISGKSRVTAQGSKEKESFMSLSNWGGGVGARQRRHKQIHQGRGFWEG